MKRPGFRGLPLLLVLAACGGGGGSSAPPATISGQISILVGAPLDREPNDTAAEARLSQAPLEGRLDAARDPVDVFRKVADRAGTYTPALASEGVQGDVLLVDLARAAAARSLVLETGDVFDVVVRARRGSGRYRVTLSDAPGDTSPVDPGEGYARCGDGFVPGEIVAAPAEGFDGVRVAAEAGLCFCASGKGSCLLRDPAAREEGGLRGLCDVLLRCARLEERGLVRYAEPNRLRHLAALPDDPLFAQHQWALEQIHAPAAWEIRTSTGVIVAVVDSGVRAHPDLEPNLVPGYDFEDGDADPTDPTQNFSHGTQVAGVIGAVGDNGTGIAGVLWSVRLMPLRAFDTAGFGTSFGIANAILYAAGLSNSSGTLPPERASVINMSFASTASSTVELDACNAARDAGLFLCAATGNQGSAFPRYPSGYPSVVAVGATDMSGLRASYSNYGGHLALVAPGGSSGGGVITTGIVAGNQYDYPFVAGTSFASPHVAAVAAMCMGLAPLTPDEAESILLSTAQDIGAPGVDPETGHGIVDAYRAVLAVLGQPTPVYIPYEEIEVRLVRVGAETVEASVKTSEAEGFLWEMPEIPSGRYRLEAGTDRNHDGDLSGPGELYGEWEGGQTLSVSGPREGLDFAVAEE
ncbi:MAG TPA: S8 family serine peptidase [Planctomycetota bacterium]|nr:S8 family serine peptidase [Planctomycetota bacterium]